LKNKARGVAISLTNRHRRGGIRPDSGVITSAEEPRLWLPGALTGAPHGRIRSASDVGSYPGLKHRPASLESELATRKSDDRNVLRFRVSEGNGKRFRQDLADEKNSARNMKKQKRKIDGRFSVTQKIFSSRSTDFVFSYENARGIFSCALAIWGRRR
jgi:hypothetical protein